jgi:hypothetical protein
MSAYKRKRLFVDREIQTALMLRVTGYWLFCMVSMTVTLLVWQMLTTPTRLMQTHFNEMLFYYGPAIAVAALLLPIVILDVLRVSNRFVGPFLRLRRAMRELGKGGQVAPIRFRKGDYWQEFADELNALIARVNAAEEGLAREQVIEESAEEAALTASK